jgi:hypothetical protein
VFGRYRLPLLRMNGCAQEPIGFCGQASSSLKRAEITRYENWQYYILVELGGVVEKYRLKLRAIRGYIVPTRFPVVWCVVMAARIIFPFQSVFLSKRARCQVLANKLLTNAPPNNASNHLWIPLFLTTRNHHFENRRLHLRGK